MTWQFSSIRLRMYSLFQKYRARSATWDRIKKQNEGPVHKQMHTYITSARSQVLQEDVWREVQCGRNARVWKRKLTWKWGLEMQAAICLNRGSCTRINWDGSITSRISSISPRNITWDHMTELYTTNTTLPYISMQAHSEWSPFPISYMSGFQNSQQSELQNVKIHPKLLTALTNNTTFNICLKFLNVN